MKMTRPIIWVYAALVSASLLGMAFVWAEPPAAELLTKPSAYAPSKDLQYQLVYLTDRIEGDLEKPEKFDRRVKRVVRDSNTIAVLALVLGNHDEENPLRGRSASVIAAATDLANKATNHADAQAAYKRLTEALQSPTGQGQVPWSCVGDIEAHMLQIPQLDTSLKSAVKPSRFATSQDKAAGLAATLAAVAHISMFDDTYCSDALDHQDWVELCLCMRDSATDLHSAIRAGDAAAADRAFRPLGRSCDECHEQFRD
jgi:hypothetical protein